MATKTSGVTFEECNNECKRAFDKWLGLRGDFISSQEYAAERAAWDGAWDYMSEVAKSAYMDGWHAGYKDAVDDTPVAEFEPPEGYVLVPVEPTEKMIEAGYNAYVNSGWIRTYEIYEAMIQAAQEGDREQKG